MKTFPLRLPVSMRQTAQRIAEEEGISLNQFISLAVGEKIVRLEEIYLMQNPVDKPHDGK